MTIPLRAYRVAPRKPWLDVDGADLLVRVPSWWGGRPWRVPLADVGVAELAALPDVPPDEVVLAEPLVTPYVYTTGPMTRPNLALVFARPVRVPGFRLLTRSTLSAEVPVRAARGDRPKGRYLDGMMLRAVDPQAAAAALVAAGAERVEDPDAWLAARRDAAAPEAAAAMERDDRRAAYAFRAAVGAGAVGLALMGAGRWLGEDVATAGGALALAGFLGLVAADWLVERRMFRRRE